MSGLWGHSATATKMPGENGLDIVQFVLLAVIGAAYKASPSIQGGDIFPSGYKVAEMFLYDLVLE